ncbi:MAG: hypothetical protein P4L51_10010 [Puia sp.]|nr:hypothetical protein [Puia sp.]
MRYLLFLLPILLFVSCKKDLNSLSAGTVPQLDKTTAYLKQQLSAADFNDLDLPKSDVTIIDSGRIQLWRVPFVGKSIATDFVLVQAGQDGTCSGGRIIHLESSPGNMWTYNGSVTMQTLARQPIVQSDIINGYVVAFHPSMVNRITTNSTVSTDVVPYYYGTMLPEVVIVGYVNTTGNPPTMAEYTNLLMLAASSPNGASGTGSGSASGSAAGGGSGSSAPGTTTTPVGNGSANVYTPLAPNGNGGTAAGSGTPTLSASLLTKSVTVEQEYITAEPAISLIAYFKCFDIVPSAGATFTIKLCSDLPVNSNPDFVTLGTTSGHAFITLTKTNGGLSVTQSFGFYPSQSPSILNPFGNIPGVVKDNGNREINASITTAINENQFATLKANSISWSTSNYNLVSNNCTNYALNLFNSVTNNPLTLDPLTVYLPNSGNTYNPSVEPPTINIPDSPQSLFVKLQQMKVAGGAAAANIVIDQTHNTTAPSSHGACN